MSRLTLLTRLDGATLYVGDGFIIEPVLPGESTSRARTKVMYNGSVHYVTEPVEEVVAKLEGTIQIGTR